MKLIRIATLTATAAIILTSCSRNPVTGKREVMFMSEGQEISMGQSYDPQVVAQYGVYQDAKLQSFIEQKGKAMAAKSHRPNLPYEFKIVDSPVVNAFAVPGGFIYFTRGIMAHFNNEAEFAGVLGHEIGHVTARHSAAQYSKQMLMQGALIGGMIASKEVRQFGDIASQGLGLLSLKYGRDDESQSDVLGVEYSTAIGYDAVEMADFFQTLTRLSSKSGQSIPDFEDNAFFHPELKFTFPVPLGWRTVNSPSQIQMAPEDGKAMITMDLAAGTDLRAAANKFVQDNKLNLIESSNVKVNGHNAIAMITESVPTQEANQQQQQQQPTLRILTYLISYGGAIYKFNGLAVATDFNTYFATMQSVMKGFKTLTDPNKLNRKPDVVDVVSVKSTGTLQQALTSHGVASSQLNELAILNGMLLTDQVQKGMLIKIIGKMGSGV